LGRLFVYILIISFSILILTTIAVFVDQWLYEMVLSFNTILIVLSLMLNVISLGIILYLLDRFNIGKK
jgi:hypothetical protein